jgi:outer membrane protein assembly factor BamB
MRKALLITFVMLLVLKLGMAQEAPKWAVDLGEPIKTYDFMQDGKLIFFTSGEYVWCYDTQTGKEVWSMEVPDFSSDGISYLLGEMYITNSSNKLQAYDALTGGMLWEKEYGDIDQSDYMSFEFIENSAVFRYGEPHIGVDLNNGNELYRMNIEYWGDLVNLGSFNYSVLYQQDKMLVMENSEIASLFDVTTGNKLLSLEEYDVNTDLIEEGYPWLYKHPEHKYLLIVLGNGAAVLDVVNNKELARKEFGIDGDRNVLLPTKVGCAVMGEEKFVHFNFESGVINELEFPIDDIRTMYAYEAEGENIVVVSMEDRMAAVDLVAGKVLWQTAEDDPEFEGFAHRYLWVEGSNLICTYNRARLVSQDSGTYLYLMSINGITGKVNYKTPALLSGAVLSDFQRSLSKIITGAFATFIAVGSAGTASGQAGGAMDMVNEMMGYSNIGFDYETFEHGGNMVFFSRSNVTMWDPATRNGPGEGIVAIDIKSGELKYKTYFEIADGMNVEEMKLLPPMLLDGDDAYIAGEEKLIKCNLATGNKEWEVGEEVGFVSELFLLDGVLYSKFGKEIYNIGLKEDDIKVSTKIDVDPYGFHAFDPASGSILWKVNTESDPGLFTPQFSILNYYNSTNGNLYFADQKRVYALKLGREGGSLSWTFDMEQNGLGELDYEEAYAIKETWIGSEQRTHSYSTYIGGGWVSTTSWTTGGMDDEETAKFLEDAGESDLFTTYESWGNIWGVSAKRCLRILYGTDVILAIGPNAIGLIDANSGSANWVSNWDYSPTSVEYIPKILKDKLLYCSDENLVLLDMANGNTVWQVEESGDSKFFESPTEQYVFTLNDEVIKEYQIIK